jgi:hypothetical protein
MLLRATKNPQGARPAPSRGAILWALLCYGLRSAVHLAFLGLCALTFALSKLAHRRHDIDANEDLIVIDTYTLVDKIVSRGKFHDPYFGELYDILNRRNKPFAVLCLLESYSPRNLRRRIAAYNILAADRRTFLTEFDLLGLRDWLDVLRFTLHYPLAVLRLARKSFGDFDRVFRNEVIETLGRPQAANYIRYRVGRRLGGLTTGKLTLIAWFENQVIDKLLCRGLRDSGARVKSYGCQFFTKPLLWRNLFPLAAEARIGVLPDVILVSGEEYLETDPGLDVRLGLSPRYNYLFEFLLDEKTLADRRGLAVLLPYDIAHAKTIVNCVAEYARREPTAAVRVKMHPNHELLQPFTFPEAWEVSAGDLAALCGQSEIVVTAGSGTALEAAVMGCSVILVGKTDGLTFHPMPDDGRGQLWDLVFDAAQLAQAADRLARHRRDHPQHIATLAANLRDRFFIKATEQRFIELFDL